MGHQGLAVLRQTISAPRFVLLMSFAGTSVINYAFSLATGRLLLPGDFGLLSFVQSILLITALLLGSGITVSLTAAILGQTGSRRAALIRGAYAANCLIALAISAAFIMLFALGPLRRGFETSDMTIVVALTLPFSSFIATSRAAAQGAERFDVVAAIQVVEIVCKAAAGTLLVLLGFGVTGAAAGFLIGAILGSILGFFHMVHTLGVRPWGALSLPPLPAAGAMFAALLGLALLLNMDLASVKLLPGGDRSMAGYYQAATILANTPYYLVTSVLFTVLFTQFARLDELTATREELAKALRLVAALVLPIEVVLMCIPRTALVLLFPQRLAPGASVLRLLAFGNSALMLLVLVATAFLATGRARIPACILLCNAAIEPIALWVAVPRWHAQGAAAIFVAASALTLLTLTALYLRAIGRQWAWRSAWWILRYLAAVAAGVLVGGILFSINEILAVAIGSMCYLAVLFPLRLIKGPKSFTSVWHWSEWATSSERK